MAIASVTAFFEILDIQYIDIESIFIYYIFIGYPKKERRCCL